MKLDQITHLYDDPGPFASAYVEVSRTGEDGAEIARLAARAARDELVEQGAPQAVAEAVAERVQANTHLAAPVSRCVVATERGVLFDALTRHREARPSHVWDALPDLGDWVEHQSIVTPFVLALVDHEGGDVLTYDDGSQASRDRQVGHASAYEHKASGGGLSHWNMQRVAEEEMARNAREVAAEVERQVRTGPSLVMLAGDPQSRQEVASELDGLQAEVVQLESGGRASDGGDLALLHEMTDVVRGRVVAANLDQVHELRQRLGQGRLVAVGVRDVLDAFVQGQVEKLFIDPAAAAEFTATVEDHPGLALGAISVSGPQRADRVLIAAAALTAADVLVERRGTMGDAPVAATLRW